MTLFRRKYTWKLIAMMIMAWTFSAEKLVGQGKVIINEVLAKPTNACGTNNEFIELLNLGPGPQDIGCYIIATDKSAFRLSPKILQPGEVYLISGTWSPTVSCINEITPTPSITVNFNFNDCNGCLSGQATSTTDGLLLDAQNAAYPIALITPNNELADALYMNTTAPASLTSSPSYTLNAGNSGCATMTFNLANYYQQSKFENVTASLGEGGNNSYTRGVDGGCTWKKSNKMTGGITNAADGGVAFYSVSDALTNLSCNTDNNSATYTSTFTSSVDYGTMYWEYVYSTNGTFQPQTAIKGSDIDKRDITINNLTPGYYSFLFYRSDDAGGCNEVRKTVTVYDPIINATAQTTYNCGAASRSTSIAITSANPTLPSNIYTLGYSGSIKLTSAGAFSSPYSGTTSSSPLTLTNITSGIHSMTLTPNFGCPRTISFTLVDPTQSITNTTGLACSGGTASFTLQNNFIEGYFPMTYTKTYSTDAIYDASDLVTTGTITSSTSNAFLSLSSLPTGNHRLVFTPSIGCSSSVEIVAKDPNPTFTQSQSIECTTNTTTLEITNPISEYFTMTFTRTYADDGNFSSPDDIITGTITSSTLNPDLRFTGLSTGYYRTEFKPASGCNKTVDFQVLSPILTYVSPLVTNPSCSGGGGSSETSTGYAKVTITNPSPASYFPITYTYVNQNSPTTVVTNTTTTETTEFFIYNLSSGTYTLTIDPKIGCTTTDITFTILPCGTVEQYFKKIALQTREQKIEFDITLDANGVGQELFIESSSDGALFNKTSTVPFINKKGEQQIRYAIPVSNNKFYRICFKDIYNRFFKSAVIKFNPIINDEIIKVTPNPFSDYVTILVSAKNEDVLHAKIIGTDGRIYIEKKYILEPGLASFQLETATLPKGAYFLFIHRPASGIRKKFPIIRQ